MIVAKGSIVFKAGIEVGGLMMGANSIFLPKGNRLSINRTPFCLYKDDYITLDPSSTYAIESDTTIGTYQISNSSLLVYETKVDQDMIIPDGTDTTVITLPLFGTGKPSTIDGSLYRANLSVKVRNELPVPLEANLKIGVVNGTTYYTRGNITIPANGEEMLFADVRIFLSNDFDRNNGTDTLIGIIRSHGNGLKVIGSDTPSIIKLYPIEKD